MFSLSHVSNVFSALPKTPASSLEYELEKVAGSSDASALLPSLQQNSHYVEAPTLTDTSAVFQSTSLPKSKKFRCIHTFACKSQAIALSPDGKMLASGSSFIKLWNLETGRIVCTLKGNTGILKSIAFSPDCKTLASCGLSQTIELWDLETGKIIQQFTGKSYGVNSITFSPDGQILASGDRGRSVQLWNLTTGKAVRTSCGHLPVMEHGDWVNSVTISPLFPCQEELGGILASGSHDKTIKLWSLNTKQAIATLKGHLSLVYAVAFSRNGQILASGSADKTIKLWDLKTKEEICTLAGHGDEVYSLAFSRDGQILASGSADKTIKLWDLKTKEEICTLAGHGDEVYSLAFSRNGQILASSSADGTLRIWLCE
ncbi:MAG: WD40 repeat domain-containing protein [Pelatocladus maniniholoensis HA4357-MV3]|jgi:tricorn protease-like protein|uniref:WD40 repeat domain-containing protein n=1 Tax=Pelatocladus maniniholoensis HA4357-MV3 TaxID=1117104 RepID=A0A9E3LUU3_9NOST|nr:WD40 repeat domain-containing protein [Pelatocladus maniniholoensis HA4357-MV3]